MGHFAIYLKKGPILVIQVILIKCLACLHMTMEVTSNLKITLKVILYYVRWPYDPPSKRKSSQK